MKNLGSWFNYVKREYEHIETPLDFSDYVPQGSGRNLYQLYVETGMAPIQAAIRVLSLASGQQVNTQSEA